MARRRFSISYFLPSKLTGMPIVTATRSTVSRASAGWRDHQVSVFVMFSARTLRFGSDIGRSLGHLLKARTAKVGGMWSVSQGLTVAGPTRRHEGSNDGGGGVGPVELFGRARSRRCGGVARIFPSTLTKFSHLISELCDLMLGIWIGCASGKPTLNDFCYLLSSVFCVGCLVQ